MIIEITTNKEIPENKRMSRDVRNWLGKVVSDNFKDMVFWHKHIPAPLIFHKPYKNKIKIINITDNQLFLRHLKDKLKENMPLKLKDNLVLKVKNVKFKRYSFNFPEKGMYIYKTSEPLIITCDKETHEQFNKIKDNKEEVEKFVSEIIRKTLTRQLATYFNVNINLDDLCISFIRDPNLDKDKREYKYGIIEYKTLENGQKIKFSYVKGVFVCNYLLPEYIGFKTGFGYGRIKPFSM